MSASDPPGESPDTQSLVTVRDRKAAFELSLQAWPSSDQGSGPHNSGIACAVVVLRHLLCHFPSQARNTFLEDVGQDAVAENPLLTAALSLDQGVAAKLCHGLRSSLPVDHLSFERLMSSETMKATVWESLYFRFFLDSYKRASKEEPWRALPRSAMPVTEENFLTWDGVQKGTLEEYLGLFRRPLIHDTTGKNLLMFTNAPLVLRLVFANESETLRFRRDMFRFTLHIATQGPCPPEAFQYSCAAAVRLRSAEDDNDTVRLYNSDGSHFHSGIGSFPWSNQWKVEDGAKYMLFFVRFDAFEQDPAPLELPVPAEKPAPAQPSGTHAFNPVPQEQAVVSQQRSDPETTRPASSAATRPAVVLSAAQMDHPSTEPAPPRRRRRYFPLSLDDGPENDPPLHLQQAAALPNPFLNYHNVGSDVLSTRIPAATQSSGAPQGTHRGSRPPTREPATTVNQEVIKNPRLSSFPISSARGDTLNPDRGRQETPASRRGFPSPIRERLPISPHRRSSRNTPTSPIRERPSLSPRRHNRQETPAFRRNSPSPIRERPPINPRRRGSPDLARRSRSPLREPRYRDRSRSRPPSSYSRSMPSNHRDSRRRSPHPDDREVRDRQRYDGYSRNRDDDRYYGRR